MNGPAIVPPGAQGAGPASTASVGARPAWDLRVAFGVVLFVAWGLLTFVWVASTVYLVGHRSVTALITAVCALALLLLLSA
jgi:hypothetical protein